MAESKNEKFEQVSSLEVKGLFGRFDHLIEFNPQSDLGGLTGREPVGSSRGNKFPLRLSAREIVLDGSRSTRAEAKPSTDKLIDKGLPRPRRRWRSQLP